MSQAAIFYMQSLIAGYFLWLGLYLISRATLLRSETAKQWRERLDLPAGLAMVLVFIFMSGIALEGISQTVAKFNFWLRATWWAIPLVAALWFSLVLRIPNLDGSQTLLDPRWRANLSWLWFGIAIFFSIAGVSTNFVFNFDAAIESGNAYGNIYLPPAWPTYGYYLTYFLGTVLLTLCITAYRWLQTPAESRKRPFLYQIFLGNLMLVLGSLFYVITYLLADWQQLLVVGDLLNVFGLAVIGRTAIRYGAWLQERNMTADFRRSFALNSVLVIVFIFIFELLHRVSVTPFSFLSVPVLIALGVVAATFSPFIQVGLDRWLLPAWEVNLRTRLDQIEKDVVTAANPQKALDEAQAELHQVTAEARLAQQREMIATEVKRIFRHKTIYKDQALANSPLLQLQSGQRELRQVSRQRQLALEHLTPADRATALRALLLRGLEAADRHPVEPAFPSQNGSQIPLLILRLGYLEDMTRPEVAQAILEETGLQITPNSRAYTEQLGRGRQLLAETLWEMETQQAVLPPT